MKQYLLKPCILFVCISTILLFPKKSYGQLNGNYTINPAKAASNSNYKNWASAVGDLVGGSRTDGGTAQGAGVSGPVIFTVYDTVYATNVSIGAITGTSYSNTITFKSAKGDSTKCVIRYASHTTSITDDYALKIDGADYLTFQQIGFERSGKDTFSTVVIISNDADNNRFIRCQMKARKKQSNSSDGFTYFIGSCVYINGSTTSRPDSLQFIQNRFLYGYNGVYCAQACTGNYFYRNTCDTNGSSGIYITFQTGLRVMNNIFNMGDFGPGLKQQHYTSYAIRMEASRSVQIANNKMLLPAVNGSVVRGVTLVSDTTVMVYNNMIYVGGGTTSCTGFAINGCRSLNIYYNNVLINNSLALGAAYYQYPATTTNAAINIVNNNLINKGAGYAVSVEDASNYTAIDSLMYNNLYTAGTYIAWWAGANNKYTSLSSFQTASGKNTNSLNLDPGFISPNDLHVSNIAINGKAIPYPKIAVDIDNETRNSSTPDIGADEFFPVTLDAGITAIDSPVLFCSGKRNVKVTFQNFGIDTLKSLQVVWTVNGTAQTGASWTGKVAPGASSSLIDLGSYTFSGNTAYAFKIWTRNPNSSNDGKTVNDTIKLTRYAAMSGTYTIGDTNIANYKSFNQSITAMAERGICGAVTFNVYNGTYNEQLGFTQLPGMGYASPVTYQSISKDSSKVKVSAPSTSASGTNNATIQLRGADYMTFKGMTFERTGINQYSQVIHIMNGSHHNTFTNCQMIGVAQTTANINGNNIWSDQTKDDFNTFKKNYIKYGNYNMLFAGVSTSHEVGTVVEGNIFEGGFKNAIQLNYQDSMVIKGNTFLNTIIADSATSDIYLYDCDNNNYILANTFRDFTSENAIRLNLCSSASFLQTHIANNAIIKGSGSGFQTNKGIMLTSSDYQNVVFNSIYFSGNASTNSGIFAGTNCSNVSIKNNNIVMEGGQVINITTAANITSCDYNNYYPKGAQYATWGGTAYSTLSDLKTASGKDANTLSIDPFFLSSTNLHIKNPLMKGAGTPVTGVTTDIDGETRNSSTPDIGADEFKLSPNDAGIYTLLKPTNGTCAGPVTIQAVIRNIGGDTLKSANITWSISGVQQTPFNWTGKLPTNARDTFIIGTYTFTTLLNPKFIIKSNLPNNQPDGIPFNDSIIANRTLTSLPGALAGKDDTICLGEQLTLGPNALTSLKYKWLDMDEVLIDSVSKITVKPNFLTSYVLEVTNKAFGCSKRDTITITVNNIPSVNAGADQGICQGASATIGSASATGFTYSWTSAPAGFTSTVANPSVKPSATTTYTLVKTIAATGCSASDAVVVTVNLPPVPKINGISSSCIGEILSYNTTQNTGNAYKWTVTGGTIKSGQNTSSINVQWLTAGTGTLEVIETNTSTCKDTVGYNIAVAAKPDADFSVGGTFCIGNNVIFTNLSVGGTSNVWNFGDGGTSTSANPTHVYATAGSFPVRLIVKSVANCADTMSKTAIINPLPVVKFGMTKTAEKTFDFLDSSTVGGGTISKWEWDFGDGDTISGKDPSHIYLTAGSFDIKLCVTSNAGCKTCVTKNYTVLGLHGLISANAIKAIPNPGSGVFRITSGTAMQTAIITNITGQIIATLQPGKEAFNIDLTNQPAGIYFVKIIAGEQTGVIKLIKQ